MSHPCEPCQIRGRKAKEVRVGGRLDDQRLRQIDHATPPLLGCHPAALSMAWRVPVGTSLDPWLRDRPPRERCSRADVMIKSCTANKAHDDLR
jgi:hypothetical protein